MSPQAAKQSRLEWNLETLVSACQQAGHNGGAWDGPASRALTEFANLGSGTIALDDEATATMKTNCAAAVEAGCDDPMIRYLYLRICGSHSSSPQKTAKAYHDVALALQNSSYPTIRKTYAAIRAMDWLFSAYGTNEAGKPLLQEVIPIVGQRMAETIASKNMPPEEVYLVCHAQ